MSPFNFVEVEASKKALKITQKDDVLRVLKADGIVRIQGANFDEKAFLDFTQSIGACIDLPAFLSPSKVRGFPELSRISNFSENSEEVDLKYAFGSYWHHDGDFWASGEHHIINLLYAQVVPISGGNTGFLDTQAAFAALPLELQNILKEMTITVDPKNIEDFRNISEEDSAFLGDGVAEHRVVQKDTENLIESLYVPFFEGTIGTDTRKFTYLELMEFIDKPEFKILHEWQPNEIVLWDNTKFMHRAMGETVGKRLLWRTQARILV
jgi:taurine dioxygenase